MSKRSDKQDVQVSPVQGAEQVFVPAPAGPVAHWNGASLRELTPDTPATQWPTSLDLTSPSGRAAVFSAGNPADVSVPLGGSVEFMAVDWLIYCEEREDSETGEVRSVGVLVLYNGEGKTLKTSSQYAPRRLKAALELYSRDEWQRGLKFTITDRPSKRPGRHYHDIRVVV